MKRELFTPVVSRLRPRLLSIASSFDADYAEDAVQEALTRLWTAWERLPEPADAERLAVTEHRGQAQCVITQQSWLLCFFICNNLVISNISYIFATR